MPAALTYQASTSGSTSGVRTSPGSPRRSRPLSDAPPGPTKPVMLTSFADYERRFGGSTLRAQ